MVVVCWAVPLFQTAVAVLPLGRLIVTWSEDPAVAPPPVRETHVALTGRLTVTKPPGTVTGVVPNVMFDVPGAAVAPGAGAGLFTVFV
jgi:hypothetical protein